MRYSIYKEFRTFIRENKIIEIMDFGLCPDEEKRRLLFVTQYHFYNPVPSDIKFFGNDEDWHTYDVAIRVMASEKYIHLVKPKSWPDEPEKIYTKDYFDRLFALE